MNPTERPLSRALYGDLHAPSTRGVQVTSPAPRELWLELSRQDPEVLPTQTPAWLDCLCALGSHRDASRLYTFPDGQQLVLPIVRRRGLLGPLAMQASLPHAWGMGGVVARRSLRPQDLRAVFDDLAHSPSLSVSLVPNPRQGELWRAAQPEGAVRIPRRAHVIDLEGGFDRVWQERFVSGTRNKVRKAEKSGLVIESDTSGRLVGVFYELFRRSIDRWAEQQREPRWRSSSI